MADRLVDRRRSITFFETLIFDLAIPKSAKILYIVLCSFCGGERTAFPSAKTLAQRANCSVRQVFRNLKILEEHGLLRRTPQYLDRGGKSSNLYEIFDISDKIVNEKTTKKTLRKEVHKTAIADTFDEFWAVYPRKESEAGAREAWNKLFPFGQSPEVSNAILERVSARLETLLEQLNAGEKTLQFTRKAQNWLRDEDWTHD
jgi:DNA-binding transcriptional MocR family regulator